MTRQRDRYQSAFDETIPGVRAAVYDVSLALDLLKDVAKQHDMMGERFTFHSGESWTVAQLLEIARDALYQSVSPVAWIYLRLQQNEEAVRTMVDAFSLHTDWPEMSFALGLTLRNKAIVRRGEVTQARRIIARRAKVAKETGGAA